MLGLAISGIDADATQPPPSGDPKINQLLATLQSEKRNLEGAKAVMRAVEASSRNEAVIQQAQNEVRSAQASIRFLEDELAKLQVGGPGSSPMRGGEGSNSRAGYGPGGSMTPSRSGASTGSGVSPSPSFDARNRPLPPPPGGEEGGAVSKPEQKNYTQLGEHHDRVGLFNDSDLQTCLDTMPL